MKVFVAALGMETNTFVPFPTSEREFAQTCLIRPDQEMDRPIANDGHTEFLSMAEARGFAVVRGTLAYAQPSGSVTRQTYEGLRDEILSQAEAAMPFDFALLNLHGAMIADGYDDCEGDLLKKLRAMVGPDVPIGGLLDLHAHLSDDMIDAATILIAFKEYPHIDYASCARELFELTEKAARKEIEPVMALADCRSLGSFPTVDPPMRAFVDQMIARRAHPGILDLSLIHGFPWGDCSDLGVKALAVCDGDIELAQREAKSVAAEFMFIRQAANQSFSTVDQALRALTTATTDKPIVWADSCDNAGGGAPSDSTFLLSACLEAGLDRVGLATVWDPLVVDIVFAAGVGAELDLRLGGKASRFSGSALDVRARVLGVEAQAYQRFGEGADIRKISLGRAVLVRIEGIDVVVNDLRNQTLSPDCFAMFGVDPNAYRLIIVKSSNHFRSAFGAITEEIWDVTTPGALNTNFKQLPYRKLRRPVWPLDIEPSG